VVRKSKTEGVMETVTRNAARAADMVRRTVTSRAAKAVAASALAVVADTLVAKARSVAPKARAVAAKHSVRKMPARRKAARRAS
jgi:hypothetical protein